jgi:hypothetical protein
MLRTQPRLLINCVLNKICYISPSYITYVIGNVPSVSFNCGEKAREDSFAKFLSRQVNLGRKGQFLSAMCLMRCLEMVIKYTCICRILGECVPCKIRENISNSSLPMTFRSKCLYVFLVLLCIVYLFFHGIYPNCHVIR